MTLRSALVPGHVQAMHRNSLLDRQFSGATPATKQVLQADPTLASLLAQPGGSLIASVLGNRNAPPAIGRTTPGINPAAPPVPIPNQPSALDRFLDSPGGILAMNLLAESGFSPVPQSPAGAVGRALLNTQQQQRAGELTDIQRMLIESQIGLNRARAAAASQPGGGEPLTQLAKLRADAQAGRISTDVFDAERRKVIEQGMQDRFDRAQALRGEFRKDTDDIQQSLQALSAARNLAATDNPTAQLASFISTIRSIDNSTVREGELEAFNNIQSLTVELEQKLQRFREGGFSPRLRDDINETITALDRPLTELLNKRKDFYRREAQRFNVEPDSVAGIPFSQVGEQPGAFSQPAATPQSVPPITQTATEFGVTPEEWEVMSPAQRELFKDGG